MPPALSTSTTIFPSDTSTGVRHFPYHLPFYRRSIRAYLKIHDFVHGGFVPPADEQYARAFTIATKQTSSMCDYRNRLANTYTRYFFKNVKNFKFFDCVV